MNKELEFLSGGLMFGFIGIALFWLQVGNIRLLGFAALIMQWLSMYLQFNCDALVSAPEVRLSKRRSNNGK